MPCTTVREIELSEWLPDRSFLNFLLVDYNLRMAGHSKWKNNLSRKTAQDKKRSSSFAKLSRAITMAVIEGGSPDPAFNPRLRVAIEKARMDSMPKDNIDRAIAKGSGPGQEQLIPLVFELFGPGGSQLIATATTDNQNRTHGEIRTLVDRHGGKLGNTGSVSHMFTHCAYVVLNTGTAPDFGEKVLALAEQLEALDVAEEGSHTLIYFPYNHLHSSHQQIEKVNLSIAQQPEALYRPLIEVTLAEADQTALATLIGALEDHDDIQDVYTNSSL